MGVGRVKFIDRIPYLADVRSFLVHLPGFPADIKADRACYSMFVETAVIPPEAMAGMQMPFVSASAIAWYLLEKRRTLRRLLPFVNFARFTSYIIMYLPGCCGF